LKYKLTEPNVHISDTLVISINFLVLSASPLFSANSCGGKA